MCSRLAIFTGVWISLFGHFLRVKIDYYHISVAWNNFWYVRTYTKALSTLSKGYAYLKFKHQVKAWWKKISSTFFNFFPKNLLKRCRSTFHMSEKPQIQEIQIIYHATTRWPLSALAEFKLYCTYSSKKNNIPPKNVVFKTFWVFGWDLLKLL